MLEEMFVTDLDGLRKVNPTRYLFIHCPLLVQNGRANWVEGPLCANSKRYQDCCNTIHLSKLKRFAHVVYL